MTPSARIKAVLEVLEKTGASRIPMDATIGDYMRHRKYIGAKDRADIVERVYNMVRAHARIGWHLERAGAPDTPRMRVIAWLALGENRGAAEIKSLFDGSKYGPEKLSDDEMKFSFSGALSHPDMPEAVRVECPPDHERTLRDYFGGDFGAEMEAMLPSATLDLRVNIRAAAREETQASLKRDGVDTDATPHSPWGLRARGKAFLSKTKAFVKGHIEIQDEGSQLIAHACGAKPGMQVLDYCAGGGGKTLALAAAMNCKGRIVAMDNEPARLEKGRQRFRRAGVSDIIEVRPLTDEKNRKWLKRQKGTFDVVLVDAPCSSTGTWRRNPDLRWRQYGPPVAELIPVQEEILGKVAKCVKPGGKLVYATCSLLPDENERQIEKFLAVHPDFTLTPPDNAPHDDKGYMRLTPLRYSTDGFFAAILTRNAS
ncbi:MAG: RsmB/NOP family class I SAM-dependent RNA methyltransferase [Proteobacteria bacterium]|nr:RsmB/NOP family class I SAM-dependent RNA methyltransferase [Pseudomonadota bacterium]